MNVFGGNLIGYSQAVLAILESCILYRIKRFAQCFLYDNISQCGNIPRFSELGKSCFGSGFHLCNVLAVHRFRGFACKTVDVISRYRFSTINSALHLICKLIIRIYIKIFFDKSLRTFAIRMCRLRTADSSTCDRRNSFNKACAQCAKKAGVKNLLEINAFKLFTGSYHLKDRVKHLLKRFLKTFVKHIAADFDCDSRNSIIKLRDNFACNGLENALTSASELAYTTEQIRKRRFRSTYKRGVCPRLPLFITEVHHFRVGVTRSRRSERYSTSRSTCDNANKNRREHVRGSLREIVSKSADSAHTTSDLGRRNLSRRRQIGFCAHDQIINVADARPKLINSGLDCEKCFLKRVSVDISSEFPCLTTSKLFFERFQISICLFFIALSDVVVIYFILFFVHVFSGFIIKLIEQYVFNRSQACAVSAIRALFIQFEVCRVAQICDIVFNALPPRFSFLLRLACSKRLRKIIGIQNRVEFLLTLIPTIIRVLTLPLRPILNVLIRRIDNAFLRVQIAVERLDHRSHILVTENIFILNENVLDVLRLFFEILVLGRNSSEPIRGVLAKSVIPCRKAILCVRDIIAIVSKPRVHTGGNVFCDGFGVFCEISVFDTVITIFYSRISFFYAHLLFLRYL